MAATLWNDGSQCPKCKPPAAHGHAFCETIAANLTHIRLLTEAGRKPSGGADTAALCGAPALWDTSLTFSPSRVEHWNPWPYGLCSKCKTAYLESQR
jgi:hypothetical protein